MKAALSGLGAWVLQRATALVLLVFAFYLLLALLLDPPDSVDAWRSWVLRPGMRIALMTMFVALALHAWVGTRDVIMDYLKPFYLRLAALGTLAAALLASVLWATVLLAQRGPG